MIFCKKAAMFGLDARIALAIFGALSVISGASLYSAIQESKIVALITTLENHSKAVTAYMLDTGKNIPADLDHPNTIKQIGELIISTETGWKGPYLPYDLNTVQTDDYDRINKSASSLIDGNFFVYAHLSSGWGVSTTPKCDGVNGEGCYYFLRADSSNFTESYVKAIDLYVDGTEGQLSGRLRYIDWGSTGQYSIYYMGPNFL